MWEQEAASECEMSPLSKLLKQPQFYLGILVFVVVCFGVDALRLPERQLGGLIYVSAVRFYQRNVSHYTAKVVKCRYRPSCSEYSAMAVQKFGVGRGLILTIDRICRCTDGAFQGSVDNVP